MPLALGLRNRCVAGVSVAGGVWRSALPAANVLTEDRAVVARSFDAATGSTAMDLDFGQLRSLQAFAMCAHNLTQAGTWRVMLGTAAGLSDVWDSGTQAAWYLSWAGVQEWESADWWGLPADEYMGHPYSAFIIAQSGYQARYMRVQIADTGNPAGYVQIGRLWASDLWWPTITATYGIEHAWADPSQVSRSLGAGVLPERRRRYRTTALSWPVLTSEEAAQLHEIRRRAGTANEVLFAYSTRDYQAQQRYGYVGRISDGAGLRHESWRRYTHQIALEEWV